MWNFAEEERYICYLYNCMYSWGFYSASCSRMDGLTGVNSRHTFWRHVHSGLVVKIFGFPTEGWEHTHSIFPKVLKEEYILIFFGGSDSKQSACNAGDLGLIPGSERSPREGKGNPLQFPCMREFCGQRSLAATVHGVTKSWTWLSD